MGLSSFEDNQSCCGAHMPLFCVFQRPDKIGTTLMGSGQNNPLDFGNWKNATVLSFLMKNCQFCCSD